MRLLIACFTVLLLFDMWTEGLAGDLRNMLRCADARIAVRNLSGEAQTAEFTKLGMEQLGVCFADQLIDQEDGLAGKLRQRIAQGDRMVETRLLLGRSGRIENHDFLKRMQAEAQGEMRWRPDRPAVPEKYVVMVARLAFAAPEVRDDVEAGAQANVNQALFLLEAMPFYSPVQVRSGIDQLFADKRPAGDGARVCDHVVAAFARRGKLSSSPIAIRTGKQYSGAELALVKRRVMDIRTQRPAEDLSNTLRCVDARTAMRDRTGEAQTAEFTKLGMEELGACFADRLIDREEGLGEKLRERIAQGDRMVETRLLLGRSARIENREFLKQMQAEAQGEIRWRTDRPAVPEKYVVMVARLAFAAAEVRHDVEAGAQANVNQALFLLEAIPFYSPVQVRAGIDQLFADKRPAGDGVRVCDHVVAAFARRGKLSSSPVAIRTGKQYSDAELELVKQRVIE